MGAKPKLPDIVSVMLTTGEITHVHPRYTGGTIDEQPSWIFCEAGKPRAWNHNGSLRVGGGILCDIAFVLVPPIGALLPPVGAQISFESTPNLIYKVTAAHYQDRASIISPAWMPCGMHLPQCSRTVRWLDDGLSGYMTPNIPGATEDTILETVAYIAIPVADWRPNVQVVTGIAPVPAGSIPIPVRGSGMHAEVLHYVPTPGDVFHPLEEKAAEPVKAVTESVEPTPAICVMTVMAKVTVQVKVDYWPDTPAGTIRDEAEKMARANLPPGVTVTDVVGIDIRL